MTNYCWKLRLEDCRQALEKNHFKAYIADDCNQARHIVFDKILPGLTVRRIAWGDSLAKRPDAAWIAEARIAFATRGLSPKSRIPEDA